MDRYGDENEYIKHLTPFNKRYKLDDIKAHVKMARTGGTYILDLCLLNPDVKQFKNFEEIPNRIRVIGTSNYIMHTLEAHFDPKIQYALLFHDGLNTIQFSKRKDFVLDEVHSDVQKFTKKPGFLLI
jgi:hypothetical protein